MIPIRQIGTQEEYLAKVVRKKQLDGNGKAAEITEVKTRRLAPSSGVPSTLDSVNMISPSVSKNTPESLVVAAAPPEIRSASVKEEALSGLRVQSKSADIVKPPTIKSYKVDAPIKDEPAQPQGFTSQKMPAPPKSMIDFTQTFDRLLTSRANDSMLLQYILVGNDTVKLYRILNRSD